MIKIAVSASRKYNVIMDRGALGRAGELFADAGVFSGGVKAAGAAGSEALMARSGGVQSGASGGSEVPAHGSGEPRDTASAVDTPGISGGRKKLCIVTDRNVAPLYGTEDGDFWRSLTGAGFELYRFVFEGGEKTKTLDTLAEILNFLADNRFTRSDVLVALGGGIVGDVTGFAAASYLRGVEFVQIPTTLLAIVDSSVGGKTGVNLNAGKNLAGAFWQPSLVIFDPDVLRTLSYDTTLDGIAEAVKSGFIGDRSITDDVSAHAPAGESFSDQDIDFLTQLAAKAVKVKRAVVEDDERETGRRQLLNFGHTIAHAIEKCSDYSISHGHAVAIGMTIVSAAADSLGWTEEKCTDRLLQILDQFRFPLQCPYSPEELTAAALQDKKIRGDRITLVIPENHGSCTLKTIPTSELQQFITRGLDALKTMQ